MKTNSKNKPRRVQILEAFADMLEANPGARITTAILAKQVGVSEAALYRHFPSKTKMFEGLIDNIEEFVFSRIQLIIEDNNLSGLEKCDQILFTMLNFAEKNKGVTRILTGDALTGETDRLHARVAKFYTQLETYLKQVLQDAEVREHLQLGLPISTVAGLWLAAVEGKILRFIRSQFKSSPTSDWKKESALLMRTAEQAELI